MADSNSRMCTTNEVLALLEGQEDFEGELGGQACTVDLHAESDDDDEAQGDGTESDGSQVLLDDRVLCPESGPIMSLMLNTPSQAESDCMLLLIPDLNVPGNSCCILRDLPHD